MPTPRIDLDDDTKLPFMTSPYLELTDEELEDVDHEAARERMQSALPPEAIELGCLQYDLAHSPGLSWKIDDHFFLIPLSPGTSKWVLIRTHWDDDWGRHEWSNDATGHDFANADEAARAMVKAVFESWGHGTEDEDDPATEARREFLARLEKDRPG